MSSPQLSKRPSSPSLKPTLPSRIQAITRLLSSRELEVVLQGYNKLNDVLMELCFLHQQQKGASTQPHFRNDDTFQEFITLQDSFKYNLVNIIITNLSHLGSGDPLPSALKIQSILLALRSTQGVLLLHPPSRDVFNIPANLQLILDLLVPQEAGAESNPQILLESLVVLIHILVKNRNNFRNFEMLQGPKVIIDLLFMQKSDKQTAKKEEYINIKFKIIEFLIFYLVDEKKAEIGSGLVDLDDEGFSIERKSRAQKTKELEAINPNIKEFIEKIEELNAFTEVYW